jgi:Collagen triple helix repeat (20 copies)
MTDITNIPDIDPSLLAGYKTMYYHDGTRDVVTSVDTIFGPQGPVGPVGPQGIQGPDGPAGSQGSQGTQGIQGTVGPTGSPGAQGIQGAVGPTGGPGPDGIQGPIGPTGTSGAQGIQGPQGPVGPTGPPGAQGVQGSQGIQGIAGIAGTVGPTGPAGNPGASQAAGTYAEVNLSTTQTFNTTGAVSVTFTVDSVFGTTAVSPNITLAANSSYFISNYVRLRTAGSTGSGAVLQLRVNNVTVKSWPIIPNTFLSEYVGGTFYRTTTAAVNANMVVSNGAAMGTVFMHSQGSIMSALSF